MGSPPAASCSPEAEPALLASLPLRPPLSGTPMGTSLQRKGETGEGRNGGGPPWVRVPQPGSGVHGFSLLVSEKDPPHPHPTSAHWLQLFCDTVAGLDLRGPRTPSPACLSPTFG